MSGSVTEPWIRENVDLAPWTTLSVGGPARFFVDARDEQTILQALEFADLQKLPVLILGGGSNLLVSDSGFRGVVIRISLRGLSADESRGRGWVQAAAGEDWDAFVDWAVKKNWGGIACLSGIPGTVGGTPIQNVGAYGEEVSDVVESVRVMERSTREVREIPGSECDFGYRRSLFNTDQRDRYIVLHVTYSLPIGEDPKIEYPDLRKFFDGVRARPSLPEVRRAVRSIRASKAMLITAGDPDCRSAGSFFKNPIVDAAALDEAEECSRRLGYLGKAESLPRYAAAQDQFKIPAAWLIERSGFYKGFHRGGVGISQKHALAIVNRGNASAREIVDLMAAIRSEVLRIFGIRLVPEPVFVGFDDE